jgi:hypothetical protein
MKCRVCGKDLEEHSKTKVRACLKKLKAPYSTDPYELLKFFSVKVKINPRHKIIVYNGHTIVSDDLDLDLMRLCLEGKYTKKEKPWDEELELLDKFILEVDEEMQDETDD